MLFNFTIGSLKKLSPIVYSLCSLLTYSLYLILFDYTIVLQMLQLHVCGKQNNSIQYGPYHNSVLRRLLGISKPYSVSNTCTSMSVT